jgi:mono/diheme cytochrome c family protein
VFATNFAKGLDSHSQMSATAREPVSIEITGNGSNEPDPGLPKTYAGDVGLLSAGFLGKNVTYYASVPIVDGGFPATAVDQLWAAYNGFSGGNGSFQVGKFPTPVLAAWTSQSLSLAGYSLAALGVGLNTVGVGDNRWGASYTQIGSGGLIGNVAYVRNTGALEGAYTNDLAAGGEGQSFVGSLQFLNPGSHFSGGVALLGGSFPLPSGASDTFTRSFALVSYSPSQSYAFNVMTLVGHDNNPNDGASGAAASNGTSYEAIYSPTRWAHLDLRYERTNDGLGTIGNNYVTDLAFNVVPNLVLTLENVSSVGARPVMSYQLLWAGPWLRPRAAAAVAVAVATASPASTSPGRSTASSVASAKTASLAAGGRLYAANCTACHGATGGGGEGADLRTIGARLTQAQVVAFIESPSGIMPHLYPATLSAADVENVAAFIRATFL